MDNLPAVLHQMQAFGIELKDKDRDFIGSLHAGTEGKKKTIGMKGKDWCKLYLFRPDRGGAYITGSFGTYRHGGSWEKVDTEFVRVSPEERERQAREREAAAMRSAAARLESYKLAALSAKELWRRGSPTGQSPYLDRKGVPGEACRYLSEPMLLRWPGRERGERDVEIHLPTGTLLVPLLRYDLARSAALRGLQFIRPDGQKIYMRGLEKVGACLRLGAINDETESILVVEGYATGLTVRAALDKQYPVFVAFDAGNLLPVVEILLELYSMPRIMICADDDWQTRDQRTGKLSNPGITTARAIAKQFVGVDYIYPSFNADRPLSATDYDDLRQHEGLETVGRQLGSALQMIGRMYG